VPSDFFTARWTGKVTPRYSERYTFSTFTDDGIRVWVDGQLIIDKWIDQGPTEHKGEINLVAGRSYDLKIEYYEVGGSAICQFFWQSASQVYEAVPASCLSQNMVSLTTGHDGISEGALDFDGVTSFVHRPSLTAVPDSQMTFTAWIKTSGVNGTIFTMGRSANNIHGEQLLSVDANGRLNYWDWNNTYGLNGVSSTVTINSGSWRHIAFVKNGGSGTYYVDGQPAGTVTGANVSHVATDFVLGKDLRSNSAFFNGAMDEVRVYNRALSAAEILEIRSGKQAVSLGDTSTVLQSSVGQSHSLFVTRDGGLWAMGDNSAGQLGDNSTTNRTTPVSVTSGVISAFAGADKSSHFLKTDGSLWAMGLNSNGQLGDGTTINRLSPVRIASNVVAVAKSAGSADHYTLYLKADGTVWASGANTSGALGDGTANSRFAPIQVFSGAKAIAAGANTSAFLKTDGTLWMAGSNASGQFGTGSVSGNTLLPVQVATSVKAVAAGAQHMVWITEDGRVWAAGSNTFGQLGNGATTDSAAAVRVGQSLDLLGSAVFAAANSTFVLTPDALLYAAGLNTSSQLGDGTTTNRSTPEQVASGVTSASAGPTTMAYVAKGLQTLDVPELSEADVLADGSLLLSGQVSSGLPITWTKISGPATVTDNVLVFSGTGTVSVQASQPGNQAYAAAPSVVRTLVLKRQFQQLSFDLPASKDFDPAPFALNASATSNLPVEFALLSGPGTLSSGSLRVLGTGTIVLKASQSGSAAFLAAPDLQRSIVVSPAAPVIQMGSLAAKTFGDTPFVLSGTANSGMPVTFGYVSGPGEVIGNTVSLLGAGTLLVRGSVSGNSNYLPGSAVFTIPVAQSPQEIFFGSLAGRTLGDAPFVLNPTTSSGLPVTLSVSGPATLGEGNLLSITGAGTVVVRASRAGDANYLEAQSVERSFEVAKKPQTISLEPLSEAAVSADGSILLSGQASSGLPITWSKLSGPATVTDNVLVFSGTGTVSVQASQPGDQSYAPAPPVVQTLLLKREFQRLTFELPATKDFDPAPFALSASATSKLPVEFALLSGPGTLSGGSLRVLGTGTIVLKASQPGSAAFLAAPDLQRSIVVSPAAAVIQMGSLAAKTFGDRPFAISGTSNSGMPVTFSLVSGPGNVVGNTVSILGAGTLVVRGAVSADANYQSGSALFTIPVAQSPQEIFFGSLAGRTLGDAPFVLNPTTSSGLPVTLSVSGPATLGEGNLLSITGAGTVVVRASRAGDANYLEAQSVERSFEVAKKPQTISLEPLSEAAVSADGSILLSGQASSGLPITWSKLSGPATVTDNVLVFSGTGTVSVQASQPGDQSYAPAPPVVQTLLLKREFQRLTFELPATKDFDPAPFALSASATSKLPVEFALLSGPGTLSGGSLRVLGTGTIVLKASQPGSAAFLAAPDLQRSIVVSPAAAVIQMGSLAAKTFGDRPFAISGTSNSGMPVTFSYVSGPGEVIGDTVSLIGAGTLVVRGSVSGNGNYLPGSVLFTIPVAKSAQEIVFEALAGRTFGDPPFVVNPISSSGLEVTLSVSGPATLGKGNLLSITGAGKVVVRASCSSDVNYLAAQSVEQSFEVARKAQEISFDRISPKVFGEPALNLSAVSTSGLPVTVSYVSGPAKLTGGSLELTAGGTVVVLASQSGDANYLPAPDVERTFTVDRASQSISFGALADRTYMDGPVALGAKSSAGLAVDYAVVSGSGTVSRRHPHHHRGWADPHPRHAKWERQLLPGRGRRADPDGREKGGGRHLGWPLLGRLRWSPAWFHLHHRPRRTHVYRHLQRQDRPARAQRQLPCRRHRQRSKLSGLCERPAYHRAGNPAGHSRAPCRGYLQARRPSGAHRIGRRLAHRAVPLV
jgi:alpha-tubulin suppressor-like RCC1 family protein